MKPLDPRDPGDPAFSFCEPVWAGPLARWHVRLLDGAGRKLGGGITTDSLCGTVPAGKGWDLGVAVTEARMSDENVVCPRCAAAYKALKEPR